MGMANRGGAGWLGTSLNTNQSEGAYKAGDPAPEGYLNWHAWAEAQHEAGLVQTQCPRCGLWKFPQELAAGGECLKCVPDGVPDTKGGSDAS